MEITSSKTLHTATLNVSISTFLLVLLIWLPSPSLGAGNAQDRDALLQIKAALHNTSFLESWNPKVEDCCAWNFVVCDIIGGTRRVTDLYLVNVAGVESGHISPAVGDLPYLEQLLIVNASLVGTIPRTITKLKRLNLLGLSQNRLSGPVPRYLSHLKELTDLDLSENSFTGSLPPSFSKLPKLQKLKLEYNQLTGQIPGSYGKFVGTTPDFYFSHNSLSGHLPRSLGYANFPLLIDLSFNNFVGDASFLFGKNKTVWYVWLDFNSFEFDFSDVEFNPEFFSGLRIDHNKIYGALPEGLGQLSFDFFNVSYNQLCGPIPKSQSVIGLQSFPPTAFLPNKCLCGAPVAPCKKAAAPIS